MDTNTLWHILQNQMDIIKNESETAHHPVLEKAFESIKITLENFLNEQVISGLPHPHPRSRIYRSEPKQWDIRDSSSDEILKLIVDKAKSCKKPAACVFDLDGTLFDVGPRTLGIIKEWLDSESAKQFDETLIKKAEKINYRHVGYSLSHAFENAGFDMRNQEVMKFFTSIERHWKKKFFDGKSLVKYDSMIPNAEKFVRSVMSHDIKIIYLTGRHFHHMFEGTTEQLKKFNLPYDEKHIFLKKSPFIEDQIFKSEEIKSISKTYDIVGNFENEYLNLGYMALEAPNAIQVIFDSQHSGRITPELQIPIYRINTYL